MKKFLAIGILLASSLAWAKGGENFLEVKNFSCGVDTYHNPLTLSDCYVQDALNGYFDKDAPFVKRGGYTLSFSSKSYSYSGQWSYTDTSNNIWMIVRSSDTIMATTGIGQATFNVKIATVSANNTVAEQSAFGNAYFVDQSQGVYYWNGTSTTFVTTSPKGSIIAEYHGRIWVTGLAIPSGLQVWGSKYLDGTTWSSSAPSLTTDPVMIQVSLADNYDVATCMFSGFNDALYVFENQHINALTGFDSTNFRVSQIGKEVGCISQGSLQQFQGGLVFGSLRGIEFFDGYTATKISQPIKNKVDPATTNSSFALNSWTQHNATDWNAGTFAPFLSLSTTTASPALTLSTGIISTFSGGTFNATHLSGGSVVLSTTSGNVPNYGFETGDLTNWNHGGSGAIFSTAGCIHGGTYALKYDCSSSLPDPAITVAAKRCSTNETVGSVSFGFSAAVCSIFTARTIAMAGLTRECVYLNIEDTANGFTVASSDNFYADGKDIVFYSGVTTFGVGTKNVTFDDFTGGYSFISSGTYTSPTLDTALSNSKPIVLATAGSTASSGSSPFTPTFVLRDSANGSTWLDIGTTTGTYTTRRYIQYISSFVPSGTQSANGSLNSASLRFTASSGTWASQSQNISTATSFGNLAVTETLDNGTIVFSVCTSVNSNMSGKVCSATTANSQIAVSTNIFVQVIATFTVTAATQTPTLNSTQVNWYSGTPKPSMASAVFDNRYWLSITTDTTDSTNDATLVLSPGPIWTIFDIKAGAFVVWKNSLYFADARPTGGAYQLEQGYTDNGVAINSFVRTKAYAPRGLITDKFFDSIYLATQNLGHYPINTSYTVDMSTSTFTLDPVYMDEVPGVMISRLSLPIDTTHQNFGKVIDFTFSQPDLNAPWKFFGGTVRYHARPPI